MKKRIVVISSIALAVVIIITSSIIIFRSGVVSYVWNESAAVLTGVDRNEKVIVGGDRKVTVFNFADKAEMTISNCIEGKEDKEIDCLKIAVKGEDTKCFMDALNDWIELYNYHGGKLFIATKDMFYVFDYYDYQPEQYDSLVRLPAYNEKEFAEKYPDFESYKWEFGWESKKARAKEHHPNLVK